MLQAFKRDLCQQIAAQLPDLEYYTSAHLTETSIPADVGHFLSQALYRRTSLEARDLITCSSPWIDFDSKSTQKMVDGFVIQLGQQGRYPQVEFQKALVRAVDFCSQYLIQPVATVAAFAVSDRETKSSSADIRRRAGYFTYHGSVLQSLEDYLNRADEIQITPADLESHLRQEAIREAKDLDTEGWLRLIDPILKTVRFAYPKTEDVPIQFIRLFLEERDAEGLSEALNSAQEASGGHLSADDLASEIRTFLAPAVSAPPPSESSSSENSDLPLWKKFAKDEKPVSTGHPSVRASEQKAEPLWKTYQQESPAIENVMQEETQSVPPGQTEAPHQTQTLEQNVTRPLASARSEDSILGDAIRHRERFIEELFESDPVAFETTIDRLSSIDSWEEASRILTLEVFRKYRIDIYGETAILFTNAIEEQVKQHS